MRPPDQHVIHIAWQLQHELQRPCGTRPAVKFSLVYQSQLNPRSVGICANPNAPRTTAQRPAASIFARVDPFPMNAGSPTHRYLTQFLFGTLH